MNSLHQASAILMTVIGALELLLSVGAIINVGTSIAMLNGMMPPDPDISPQAMLALTSTVAVLTVLAGTIHIAASINMFRYKRQWLAWLAVGISVVNVTNCYCLFPSIVASVLTAVSLLNEDVVRAYRGPVADEDGRLTSPLEKENAFAPPGTSS